MENLTHREQEIFELLLKSEMPKEIGYKLGIRYGTVLFHQNNIYRKLGIHSSNELLLKCLPAKGQKKDIYIKLDIPENLIFTFDDHSKYYEGTLNWVYQMPAKDHRIMEGDIYSINCAFLSDVKIDVLKMVLIDNTLIGPDKGIWRELSAWQNLAKNIEPNIIYTASYKMITHKSSGSELPIANRFVLYAGHENKDNPIKIPQPTLTFKKIEIIKHP